MLSTSRTLTWLSGSGKRCASCSRRRSQQRLSSAMVARSPTPTRSSPRPPALMALVFARSLWTMSSTLRSSRSTRTMTWLTLWFSPWLTMRVPELPSSTPPPASLRTSFSRRTPSAVDCTAAVPISPPRWAFRRSSIFRPAFSLVGTARRRASSLALS